MKAIADEIAATQPLLVGLQEAALWRTGPVFQPDPATVVQADFVQMLLAALAERGLPYAALAVVSGSDAEVPTSLGIDVRLTLQDAILARTDLKTADLKLSNLQTGYYKNYLSYPTVIGTITFPRQWASVDVKIRGKEFRFVTTHLEAYHQAIRVAQAQELLALLAQSKLPIILVGDFNSQPADRVDAAYVLLEGGLRDLWSVKYPSDPGFTCCQAPDLANPDSILDQRIDLILARGGFTVVDIQRVGEDPLTDKTPSGLWPSDHAGIVATVALP